MNFSRPPNRPSAEPILPMINVVFLLLIFFLLASQIVPRAPFLLTPPHIPVGVTPDPNQTLFMASDGQLFLAQSGGQDPLLWLAVHQGTIQSLTLRADGQAAGKDVAALLTKLSAIGIPKVSIVGVNR